ncbi:response regulator [Massilia sp. METH4]|uniref:response regulator n=1 Tax=Massilia sp. METH4 TaxID=3123041 RepID=UPI0030D06ACA
MNYALRILLLDDDAFMLDMLSDMIAGLGYANVHAATDARSALKVLPTFKPDLLVCDLSMPEMDGIEFLRAVAERGFAGGVILLSGMDSGILRAAETLAMAQGLTIVGACSKPLSRAALADLLEVAGGSPAGGTR